MRDRSRDLAIAISAVLRTLAVCAPAAIATVHGSTAAASEPPSIAAAIPAQSLARALEAFARQTGLQLVYVSGVVRHQTSHAVSAGLGAEEALKQLLRGTGLEFEYLTPHSVRILAEPDSSRIFSKSHPGDQLSEITVTANRRLENLQDVPITIQVLTNETLSRLNITTFEDLLGNLPGVTAHGIGPSQNNVYIRGLGTGDYGNQAAGSNGSFPNVAIYLDEQSAQLPGRNLDVYAADLDRIEVLEGPQGTLFGAGAEAGVLRYITNKPKLNTTESNVSAAYASTAHGDPSSAVQAMINLPIIADRLAARAVIYDETRGGYINNIPATFVRTDQDRSISYAGGSVPANSVVINNSADVAQAFNPVTYTGLRVEALYQMSADWSALLSQSFQNMQANGVFAEAATNSLGNPQPDLTVQLYNPSYDNDRFENTALTVEGTVANMKLLYAGSYLVRNVEQVQDYTAYAHSGFYADYYQCVIPGPPSSAKCFTPSSYWRDVERNTHLTQELRLNTPGDKRIRSIGGLFYEDYKIQDQGDWFYLTALPYFNPIAPPTGYYSYNGHVVCGCNTLGTFVASPVTSNNPDTRPLGDAFFNDITRGYRQKAAYESIDFDLVPRVLTLTAGTRYSVTNPTELGSIVGSFGCERASDPPNPCINRYFVNLNAQDLNRTYSGFRSRMNLSWKPAEDALLYYTWSQGFRAGGFNRSFQVPDVSPLAYVAKPPPYQEEANIHGGWSAPVAYAPDKLINNEIGWKTTWLDKRLQWNGALYQEEWEHAQIDAFASHVLPGATINGGNYRVRGLSTSIDTRAGNLALESTVAWNHSALVKQAPFYWADGTPINFSTLQASPSGPRLANPAGALGSPLAGAPTFQGNMRARYDVPLGTYRAFAQVGVTHQSDSLSTTDRLTLDMQGNSVAYELPSFTTYDAALGVQQSGWLTQLYGENLTDTRAQLFANYAEGYKAVTTNRPRTIGIRFSYSFSNN